LDVEIAKGNNSVDLLEILKLLGAQNDNRNGVRSPGVYTPKNTTFSLYDGGEDEEGGRVRPFFTPNKAEINATATGAANPDLTNMLYTIFHEGGHTAQSPLDIVKDKLGLDPLSKNKFTDYYHPKEQPPSYEALATMRGMEAMMPEGKTIWDMKDMKSIGKVDGPEKYLQETLKNNPRLNREGAKRLIDTRMFPEHSLMHESKDFSPEAKRKKFIESIIQRLNPWMK
jgi:hypothetical protein